MRRVRALVAILVLGVANEAGAQLPFSVTPVTRLVSAGFSIRPSEFAVWNGALYFSSIDPMQGVELWRYDGTTAEVVTDIAPGPIHSTPQDLIPFQNALYFTATDGTRGRELWRFDGQTASIV